MPLNAVANFYFLFSPCICFHCMLCSKHCDHFSVPGEQFLSSFYGSKSGIIYSGIFAFYSYSADSKLTLPPCTFKISTISRVIKRNQHIQLFSSVLEGKGPCHVYHLEQGFAQCTFVERVKAVFVATLLAFLCFSCWPYAE